MCVDVRLPSTVHFPLALPSPTRAGAGWARTCTRASAIAANLMLIGLYGNYDIASGAPQMSAYDVAAQSNPAVYDTATNAPPAAGFGRNKKGSLRIHKYDQYDTAKC